MEGDRTVMPHLQEPDKGTTDSSSSSTPIFTVDAFYPVFITSWIKETGGVCSICRNLVEGPCVSCQNAGDISKECYLCWGKCGHAFHKHCISRWLPSRNVCPLDCQPWEKNLLWNDSLRRKPNDSKAREEEEEED